MTDMQLRPILAAYNGALPPTAGQDGRTAPPASQDDKANIRAGDHRPEGGAAEAIRKLLGAPELTGPPPAFEVNILDQRFDREAAAPLPEASEYHGPTSSADPG